MSPERAVKDQEALLFESMYKDVEDAVFWAYEKVADDTGEPVGPVSRKCFNVSYLAVCYLEPTLTIGDLVPPEEILDKEVRRGRRRNKTVKHACLAIYCNGKKYVGDGQYLQFVPRKFRKVLPAVMFFELPNSPEAFGQVLQGKYHIPSYYHHHWLGLFFPGQLAGPEA